MTTKKLKELYGLRNEVNERIFQNVIGEQKNTKQKTDTLPNERKQKLKQLPRSTIF